LLQVTSDLCICTAGERERFPAIIQPRSDLRLGMLAAGEALAAEPGDAKPLPEQLGVLDPNQAYLDRFLDAERSCAPMVLTDDYRVVVARTCYTPAEPRFPTGGP
jgi:hypothetical protein